jgi:hypothetical protein
MYVVPRPRPVTRRPEQGIVATLFETHPTAGDGNTLFGPSGDEA